MFFNYKSKKVEVKHEAAHVMPVACGHVLTLFSKPCFQLVQRLR